MSNIFEITNKDGKVVRRGYIPRGTMQIDTEPGDYAYRIINIDTDKVLSEGRILEPVEVKKEACPFFVYAQAASEVKIYAPLWKAGYDRIIIEDLSTGLKCLEKPLATYEAILKLIPGKYRGYLEKSAESLRSDSVTFSVFEETVEDFEMMLKTLSGKEDLVLDKELSIFQVIEKIEDVKASAIADLLMAKRSIGLCGKDQLSISQEFFTEIETKVVLSIDIYEKSEGVWVFQSRSNIAPGKISLDGEVGKKYKARLTSGGALLGEVVYAIREESRDVLVEETTKKSRMKETMSSYESRGDSDFIKWDRLSAPYYQLLDPVFVDENGESIEVRIENWAYASMIPGTKYLVIKDRNKVYSSIGEAKIPITEEMSVDKLKHGILFPEIVLWLEDEKGNRISHMASTTEEGLKKSVMGRILKRIERYMSVRFLTLPGLVKETYKSIIDSEDTLLSEITMTAAKKLLSPNHLSEFNKYMEVVLDSDLETYPLADSVLSGRVTFDKSYKDLIFRKGDNPYLVELIEIPIEGEPSRSVHRVEIGKTFRLKPACYYIAYPISIDRREYLLKGGYVFLNTLKEESIAFASKIQLEVVE